MKKKKILSVLLTLALGFSLCMLTACAGNSIIFSESLQSEDGEDDVPDEEDMTDMKNADEYEDEYGTGGRIRDEIHDDMYVRNSSGESQAEEDDDDDPVAHPSYVPSKEVRDTDDGNLLVLINKEYTISRDYEPIDMVDIDGSLSTNQNLKVKSDAYDAYLAMHADAEKEGLDFYICSAYRSYAAQESLYNNSLAAYGKEYTDARTAYPGKSEHHTGYAIDVTSASMHWSLTQDYADYPDGAWIAEHCCEYGFIIRYPKGKESITGYTYEPWHLRYVGVDIATYITENDLTLEEYLGVA